MLRRIGKVVSLPKGFATVELEGLDPRAYRYGLPVLDSKGARVGIASDVIGSVAHPYAVVRLSPGAMVSIGDELFLQVPEGRRRRGRRRRR